MFAFTCSKLGFHKPSLNLQYIDIDPKQPFIVSYQIYHRFNREVTKSNFFLPRGHLGRTDEFLHDARLSVMADLISL